MKKLFTLLLFITAIAISNKAEAKGIIAYHNGLTYNIIEQLPSDCTIDGQHVNMGVIYDQFGLFWLPVWNYGTPEYALISDDEKTYWSLNNEEVDSIKSEYNITIPDKPSPSLWNKIGLKPVITFLIIYMLWSIIKPKDKKPEEDPVNDQQTTA